MTKWLAPFLIHVGAATRESLYSPTSTDLQIHCSI
ncbi:hypothetical protein BofuT4_uP136390.1 [Botrytis cinerea T4]|uniref:Uncharacterized protein n=1 Tax=Botryotinia fuckeliana (strain T4) TaxID=999810 RepID=G2YPP6_BOTF4|nr:hypothetical protein BofuT4_uP136390.1 [Botrytis cinerea T4]